MPRPLPAAGGAGRRLRRRKPHHRHVAHKESDRAETLREEYAKVGIEIDLSTPDVMRIRGGAIRPARVFSHGDHRIAMSMAVSALRSSGAITIEGAEAVAKSYPRFFEDLESLRVN